MVELPGLFSSRRGTLAILRLLESIAGEKIERWRLVRESAMGWFICAHGWPVMVWQKYLIKINWIPLCVYCNWRIKKVDKSDQWCE
jgi:hypothetical protein